MVLRATTEFHLGAGRTRNEADRFFQSVKRGGTAEVDACRFRPQMCLESDVETMGQRDGRYLFIREL